MRRNFFVQIFVVLVAFAAPGVFHDSSVRADANEVSIGNSNYPLQSSVALGDSHTCVIKSNGDVYCWGAGASGRIGDGTTWDRITPVKVPTISNAIAVTASNASTCALIMGGSLKCWGLNGNGQLGDGTTTNRLSPVSVSSLGSTVRAISSTAFSTCALTTVGGVKCWGLNSNGQVGDGTTAARYLPVDVIGLTSGVVAVSAGSTHACAIKADGTVKCWGQNQWGQLGDGSTADKPTPVDVLSLGDTAVAISASNVKTCALLASGTVKCWGSSSGGLFGPGITGGQSAPVQITGLPSGIESISVGDSHFCVATNLNGVKCWGGNTYGQLGDGTFIQNFSPVDVSTLQSGVSVVSVGATHSCAITTSGATRCWGRNTSGQLGNGQITSSNVPVGVSTLGSGVGVTTTSSVPAGSGGAAVTTTTSLSSGATSKTASTVVGGANTKTTVPTTNSAVIATTMPTKGSTGGNGVGSLPGGATEDVANPLVAKVNSGEAQVGPGVVRAKGVRNDPQKKREQSAESFAILATAMVASIAAVGSSSTYTKKALSNSPRSQNLFAHFPDRIILATQETRSNVEKKVSLKDNFDIPDSLENSDGGEITVTDDNIGNVFLGVIHSIRFFSRIRFLRPGLRRWAEVALLRPFTAAVLPFGATTMGWLFGYTNGKGVPASEFNQLNFLVFAVAMFVASIWTPVFSIFALAGVLIGMVGFSSVFLDWLYLVVLVLSGLMLIPLMVRGMVGPKGTTSSKYIALEISIVEIIAVVVAWGWLQEMANTIVGGANVYESTDKGLWLGAIFLGSAALAVAFLARKFADGVGRPRPIVGEPPFETDSRMAARYDYVQSVPVRLKQMDHGSVFIRALFGVVIISVGLQEVIKHWSILYAVLFVLAYYLIQFFHEKRKIREFSPVLRTSLLVVFASAVAIGKWNENQIAFLMAIVCAVTALFFLIRTRRLWGDPI